MNKKSYLGIDIGGTAVKIGFVSEDGEILAKTEASVSFDGYETPVIDTVLKTAREFAADHKEIEISGIGVSAAGQIDKVEKIIAGSCGNIKGWNGTRIGDRLKEAFGKEVTLANDANCMCLGEVWTGAAKGKTDVIGITIGTGIGGGIVTGGQLLEGKRGLGGELGHMPTHAVDGIPCPCGQIGCYERYAATTALVRNAKKVDSECENGRIIFEKAAAGDETILKVLDAWIDEIAAGLVGMVHLFNPELILIGGGVSRQEELLIRPLRERILKNVMPAYAEGLEIRAAALGNDAGLVGAVRNFLDTCGRN